MYLEVNTWLYIKFRQLNYQEGEMFSVAFCHFIWSFQVKYNVFCELLSLQVAEALNRLTT